MTIRNFVLATALFASPILYAQEGPTPTQAIVTLDTKAPQSLTTQNLKAKVNNHNTQLTAVTQVKPNGTEVALLIDDGLRTSVGRQLSDISKFIKSLPEGTEIFVGYMQNGRVVPQQPFTTDHETASGSLRLPMGTPGLNASPYFCLSDFVKHWPGDSSSEGALLSPKARFIIMLTNGVDPYNGSVSPLNQNSPYVDTAIHDAQRAGVPVYSIYYGNSGLRGGAASFSGQSYLAKVADETGGTAYFEGLGNPVSLTPFFDRFRNSIGESFVATFPATAKKSDLVELKLSTSLKSTKLQAPHYVQPGTRILPNQPAN